VIRYTTDVADLTPDRLTGFWEGWPTAPSPEMHLRSLRGAELAILAIDDSDHDERVVGFITVVGDGVLSAFIPFLEVLPAHRSLGIATELLRRAVAAMADRYGIDLVCDDDIVAFYEARGFTAVRGMARRNVDALADS
jgi:ribosomal protein S18 acetylase RimI-like enzyme